MNQRLEAERAKNSSVIEHLRDDFKENHTVYAKQIMQKILEV